jgi:putative ubiquitin-RnfH superfamily antitoxin RatB of RatAB toxin-antitoxin module
MAATEAIAVTAVLAPAPRTVWEQDLCLPTGCTVMQAWSQTPWAHSHPCDETGQPWSASIWGRKVDGATVLREGDRIEWLRPLTVDPKVARRERFKGQGVRGAGLFSRRKPSP